MYGNISMVCCIITVYSSIVCRMYDINTVTDIIWPYSYSIRLYCVMQFMYKVWHFITVDCNVISTVVLIDCSWRYYLYCE